MYILNITIPCDQNCPKNSSQIVSRGHDRLKKKISSNFDMKITDPKNTLLRSDPIVILNKNNKTHICEQFQQGPKRVINKLSSDCTIQMDRENFGGNS